MIMQHANSTDTIKSIKTGTSYRITESFKYYILSRSKGIVANTVQACRRTTTQSLLSRVN